MRKIIIILVIIAALFGASFLFKNNSANQPITIKESLAADQNTNSSPAPIENKLPDQPVTPLVTVIETPKPTTKTNVQIIKATITEANRLQPDTFTVKANVPVRFEIETKDTFYGCMDTITMYDFFEDTWDVKAGQKIVMEFTPKKAGVYYITCAMGVPWGSITVK